MAAMTRQPDGENQAAKRARRAMDRAYNEAVIGQALSDEAVARGLQQAEEEGGGGGAVVEGLRHGRGRGRKGRGGAGVKERLERKLLRGVAFRTAQQDASRDDQELRRERSANVWENK
jgi:hypothetical protein